MCRTSDQNPSIDTIIQKPKAKIKILDFGMGWGTWAQTAIINGYKVVGLELSKKRIAHAQKNNIQIVSSLDKINDEHYDYIYSNQVFEHLPDPRKTLSDLRKKLNKQGVLHIQVPKSRFYEKK